jgi:hypothetical protein
VLDGANRHDTVLFGPTLHGAGARSLLTDIETLHLDRGYDNGPVRQLCAEAGIDDLVCAAKRRAGEANGVAKDVPLGLRWPIEQHQLVAVQLRTTSSQHRPSATPPTGSTRTRHRLTAHSQTHRLARPMEPTLTRYPLKLLAASPEN